jgi:hypothetical protein
LLGKTRNVRELYSNPVASITTTTGLLDYSYVHKTKFMNFNSEDLTAKEEETEMFKEYIKSVGGLQNIKHKLNSVNQRFQALGMQNTQLAALIE